MHVYDRQTDRQPGIQWLQRQTELGGWEEKIIDLSIYLTRMK